MFELEGNQDHADLSFLPPGLYILNRNTGKEVPQYATIVKEEPEPPFLPRHLHITSCSSIFVKF
jgi:hypothetical protein